MRYTIISEDELNKLMSVSDYHETIKWFWCNSFVGRQKAFEKPVELSFFNRLKFFLKFERVEVLFEGKPKKLYTVFIKKVGGKKPAFTLDKKLFQKPKIQLRLK